MAIVTVVISKNRDLVYLPSNKVRHGDTVSFALNVVSGASDATVNPPTCLEGTEQITLNVHSLHTLNREEPVAAGAAVGSYPFTVLVPSVEVARSHGLELETKNGNLEVTTDPPEL
ncbi:hypothetical protein A176_001838 [Myxococcus hansupus]|uniref:Uncharacterized protein n=1 Tax=Pseudomyxococcus hansupus TaxID=1297742 RepID=A0A0H4WNB1_9BACT|nr:hypothetical protein [Myxococcus hansupus]AKQ64926.1 hypothetical protein A176_001838 [Myxococcus hansupus]